VKHAVAFGAEVAIAMAAVVAAVAVLRAVLAPRGAAGTLGSGLSLTLEFLLAAGLLRLATRPSLSTLGMAAFIILLRKVISMGLRYAQAAAAG
jgi:uncharacterized membrane protein